MKNNDLASNFPKLVAEWDLGRNAPLTPQSVKFGSKAKVWWICNLGHSWSASINSRTTGVGCPVCANRKILKGFNDLATTHPELAEEFDHNLNLEISVFEISAGSSKHVWWLCHQGHSWKAKIANRKFGRGCPVCSNQSIVPGVNDLLTIHPLLKDEWDYELNKPFDVSLVAPKSGSMFWWKCQKGHNWKASPLERSNGRGCAVCANRQVQLGVNNLGATNPELLEEWDFSKNKGIDPSLITAGYGKLVSWKCRKGHTWKATPINRRRGTNCPECPWQKAVAGENDLATTHPSLALQWDFSRNLEDSPQTVTFGSPRSFWWVCDQGHSWKALLESRVRGKTSCPVCKNQRVLKGFNDLQSTHPSLASQWNAHLNSKTPDQVLAGTPQNFWWTCESGHTWKASPVNRARGDTGCPVCINQQLLTGYNDLKTLFPEISAEWNHKKNGELKPGQVLGGAKRKVWWLCPEGHEYFSSVQLRTSKRKTGCPRCGDRGYDPTKAGICYFIKHQSLRAMKIGVTNRDAKSDRLGEFQKQGWIVVFKIESEDGLRIFDLETKLHRWVKNEELLPSFLTQQEMGKLGGWSETFSDDALSESAVIDKMNTLWKQLAN